MGMQTVLCCITTVCCFVENLNLSTWIPVSLGNCSDCSWDFPQTDRDHRGTVLLHTMKTMDSQLSRGTRSLVERRWTGGTSQSSLTPWRYAGSLSSRWMICSGTLDKDLVGLEEEEGLSQWNLKKKTGLLGLPETSC